MAFDNTNTAIAFVEQGLFNKEKIEEMFNNGNKPVIVIKVNVNGVEKEISMWFSKDKNTGEYNTTKQGIKFLTGKVKEPYKSPGYSKENSTATPPPSFDKPQHTPLPVEDEDIPF